MTAERRQRIIRLTVKKQMRSVNTFLLIIILKFKQILLSKDSVTEIDRKNKKTESTCCLEKPFRFKDTHRLKEDRKHFMKQSIKGRIDCTYSYKTNQKLKGQVKYGQMFNLINKSQSL